MIQRIDWDDKLLLHVPEIDKQHKKLIQITNKLYTAASGTQEQYKKEMPDIIKELVDYTVYHFDSEERFMEKYNYAGLAIHKLQHENFVEQVKREIQKLSDSDRQDGLQLYVYLEKWVVNHIEKSDFSWARVIRPALNTPQKNTGFSARKLPAQTAAANQHAS